MVMMVKVESMTRVMLAKCMLCVDHHLHITDTCLLKICTLITSSFCQCYTQVHIASVFIIVNKIFIP